MKEIFVLVLVLLLVLVRTISITITSTIRYGGLSTSTIYSSHRYIGSRTILRCGDHILALIAEYLERFVEDRSQLREDRATTSATTFVMLDLRLWDAHAIHFPIDVFPS